jgi:hypothetical protein
VQRHKIVKACTARAGRSAAGASLHAGNLVKRGSARQFPRPAGESAGRRDDLFVVSELGGFEWVKGWPQPTLAPVERLNSAVVAS